MLWPSSPARSSGYSVNCLPNWAQTFTLDPFGNLSDRRQYHFTPGYDIRSTITRTAAPTTPTATSQNDDINTYSWDGGQSPQIAGNS